MFRRIPGTKDILPTEVSVWQQVEVIARAQFKLYNYREIHTPIVEEEALFNRSLGNSAEIVQKQMFLIRREQDAFALRPEATASVVRAYIENSLDKSEGFIKLFYMGPMFRYERPQKGRLRQFHHVGCEVIGSYEPAVDIEVISLADSLLKALSINGYAIQLNSLGCQRDREVFNADLSSRLREQLPRLCQDCQARFEHNILRILDCKQESCKNIIAGLKINLDHLCGDCSAHFNAVTQGLRDIGITFRINPLLVRGLDYYTRTVFEINHPQLGAQDAIGAGGRYDNLVKQLQGPDTGAMGFAFGVERLLLATTLAPQATAPKVVYVISLGEAAKKESSSLLARLRLAGICCDTDYENKSLKGALRKANDLEAGYVVIIGDDELQKGVVMLKDMATGEQKEVSRDNIVTVLQNPKLITHNS